METQPLTSERPFMPPCQWNLVQFGLLCSYTMGLDAIWRFPYLVYKHTGLFLVAYYILLVLICVPVTFIQLKLGGILNRGIVRIFSHYLPALKGVAVAVLLISFLQCAYWNVYVGYGLYYLCAAIKQPYVWSTLPNATQRSSDHFIYYEKSPAADYYFNQFLQVTVSLDDPGSLPWYLGLSLLAAWVITFLCVFRGPSWFGKIVYGSSPLSLVVLVALLIYSHAAIPTAYESLGHFFTDQRHQVAENGHTNGVKDNGDILKSELTSPLTWIRALEQHVYSLGLWAGLVPTLGAHLGNKKPASNLTWLIVLLVHSMLPHLGTIAIAPFIHALAVKQHLPFEKVIREGPALAFAVLPEAFLEGHISPLWAALFFLLLVLFILHQQCLLLVVIMENIVQSFPVYSRTVFKRREFLAAALCTFAFLLGLPQITQGGSHLLQLVSVYLYRLLPLLILLCVPPFVIAYVKLEAFHLPIERLFMCVWFSLASLAACGLLVYNQWMFVDTLQVSSISMPGWGVYLGWAVAVGPILLGVVGGFIHAFIKSTDSGHQKFLSIFKPNPVELVPSRCADLEINGTLGGEGDSSTLKRRRKLAKQAATEAAMAAAAAMKAHEAPLAELEVSIPATGNGEIIQL